MSGRIMIDDGERDRPAEKPAEPAAPASPPAFVPPVESRETRPESRGESQQAQPEAEQETPEAVQKRMDRLTWERHEARRRAEAAEAELAAVRQQQQPYGVPPEAQQAEARGYHKRIEEERTLAFNAKCNDLFSKGMEEYGADAMQENVRRLNTVGWGDQERTEALRQVTEFPDAHRIYAQLAQNLDEAHRVLSLPTEARAVALARMSNAPNGHASAPPLPPPTRAPAPLRPISANSQRPEKPLDQVSIGEFIQRRDRGDRGPSHRIRR